MTKKYYCVLKLMDSFIALGSKVVIEGMMPGLEGVFLVFDSKEAAIKAYPNCRMVEFEDAEWKIKLITQMNSIF